MPAHALALRLRSSDPHAPRVAARGPRTQTRDTPLPPPVTRGRATGPGSVGAGLGTNASLPRLPGTRGRPCPCRPSLALLSFFLVGVWGRFYEFPE